MRLRFAILICGLMLLPGCIVIRVTARNPIPEMTTIAVVPFFNLTQEPNSVVDGRRFALAYYSELQKTQGFEVIPVGISESAILEHRLELQNPQDALKLCRILNADAIVVGAVTDYEPYYPQRIGLQVDWYSPYEWTIPTTNVGILDGTTRIKGLKRMQRRAENGRWCAPIEYRGQSPDGNIADPRQHTPYQERDLLDPHPYVAEEPHGHSNVPSPRLDQVPTPADLPEDGPSEDSVDGSKTETNTEGVRSVVPEPLELEDGGLKLEPGSHPDLGTVPPPPRPAESAVEPKSIEALPPIDGYTKEYASEYATGGEANPAVTPRESSYDVEFDPTQPLMSYTRQFDGSEGELVNKLRDYLELRGDRRQGSWEEYLHRSEDFIRFVSHVMIVEMLSAHGGANRTQIVFKLRKYR